MTEDLRSKDYFDDRATQDMARHLVSPRRTMKETLACACRILAMTGQEAGLAGQISARSDRAGAYWTLRFGLGFDEATPDDFIEVDGDLNTLTGSGMPNPATRFHLWVYEARPDVQSIVHTHSPWASALAAARQPLVIAQMDMTPCMTIARSSQSGRGCPLRMMKASSSRGRWDRSEPSSWRITAT